MTESKKTNLATAMLQFRTLLKQPKKDGLNPHFKSKYITLDGVVAAIDVAAEAAGITYVQMTDYRDGAFVLVTTIMHPNGESVSGSYLLPSTGKPQEIGSALTYARRYALSAAFGVVADEDDDGNFASGVGKKEHAPKKETPPPPPATATFETDKQYLLAAQDVESLKTYFDGVKKRKDSFHAHEYAELVTITTSMNKKFKGEL